MRLVWSDGGQVLVGFRSYYLFKPCESRVTATRDSQGNLNVSPQ